MKHVLKLGLFYTSLLFIAAWSNLKILRASMENSILSTYISPSLWIPSIISLVVIGGLISLAMRGKCLTWFFVFFPLIHIALVGVGLIIKPILIFIVLLSPFNYMGEAVAIGYVFTRLAHEKGNKRLKVSLILNVVALTVVIVSTVANTHIAGF